MLTSCDGSTTGSDLSSSWSYIENIAAFAPIPSPRERTATPVTNGVFASIRTASFRFGIGGPRKRSIGFFDALAAGSTAVVLTRFGQDALALTSDRSGRLRLGHGF